MKALDRKLLRDLANMKGQAFTIALVVAAGVGAFISQITTYDSLNWSRQSYYETTRFAHVFAYASRGGVLPDDRGFGVFWINRQRLASAFDMDGAFNHVVLRMMPGANERAIIDALDRLLEPYGALGAYGRDEQLSNKMLSQEINQQKTMSTVFPVIFLGVAAFLLNVVLSRQIATQRGEIAALKAMAIPTPRSPRTTSNRCCC